MRTRSYPVAELLIEQGYNRFIFKDYFVKLTPMDS